MPPTSAAVGASALDQHADLWHLNPWSFDARHLAPWSWRDVAPSPWRVTALVFIQAREDLETAVEAVQ